MNKYFDSVMYGFGPKVLQAYYACDPNKLSPKDPVGSALLGRLPYSKEAVLLFAWKALVEHSCDVMVSYVVKKFEYKENPYVSGTKEKGGPYLSPTGMLMLLLNPNVFSGELVKDPDATRGCEVKFNKKGVVEGFEKKSGPAKEGYEDAGNTFVSVLCRADTLEEKNTDPYALHSALYSPDAEVLLGLDEGKALLLKDFRPELLPGTDVSDDCEYGNGKNRVVGRDHGSHVWTRDYVSVQLLHSTPDQLHPLRLNADGTFMRPLRVAPKDAEWNSKEGKWERSVVEEPSPASTAEADGSAAPQVAFGDHGPSNAAAPTAANNPNASAAADSMMDEDEAANDAAGAE